MSLLRERLDQLTDDLLEGVSIRVYDQGWQDSGGAMPFADTVGVLKRVLGELRDAETDGLCEDMPKTLLQTLNGRLTNIHSYCVNTRDGSNQTTQMADETDRLHLDVWQGGFRYRGKRVLGYEAKYQQMQRLSKEAEAVRGLRAEAEQLADGTEVQRDRAQELSAEIGAQRASALQQAEEVTAINQRAVQTDSELQLQVVAIQQKAEAASESAATALAKTEAASAHEQRLRQFVDLVDTNEKKLNDAVAAAAEGLRQHGDSLKTFQKGKEAELSVFKADKESELEALISRLVVVEKDINDKLSKATGITLFHTFDERQKQISGNAWLVSAGVLLAGGLIGIFCLLTGERHFDVAFFTRLGFAVPVALGVGFALSQYGKERRLKEEYAFKSALSLSLEAYRRLVEEAIEKLTPDQRGKFSDFLVSSIAGIFESPTERVFGDRRTKGPADTKVIASTLQHLKDLNSALKGELK